MAVLEVTARATLWRQYIEFHLTTTAGECLELTCGRFDCHVSRWGGTYVGFDPARDNSQMFFYAKRAGKSSAAIWMGSHPHGQWVDEASTVMNVPQGVVIDNLTALQDAFLDAAEEEAARDRAAYFEALPWAARLRVARRVAHSRRPPRSGCRPGGEVHAERARGPPHR